MSPFPGHALIHPPQDGISLRDYFAGIVLQALATAGVGLNREDYKQGAECCYAAADAMLAARTKEPTP